MKSSDLKDGGGGLKRYSVMHGEAAIETEPTRGPRQNKYLPSYMKSRILICDQVTRYCRVSVAYSLFAAAPTHQQVAYLHVLESWVYIEGFFYLPPQMMFPAFSHVQSLANHNS